MRALLLSIALLSSPAFAQDAVVDTHVHLHKGEASLAEYRAQLKAANLPVEAFGAMWFGGPNQLPKTLEAFAKLDLTDAERAKIRANNARKLLGF